MLTRPQALLCIAALAVTGFAGCTGGYTSGNGKGNGGGAGVPAAPTGLQTSAGNAQVSLSWSVSANATGYYVKRPPFRVQAPDFEARGASQNERFTGEIVLLHKASYARASQARRAFRGSGTRTTRTAQLQAIASQTVREL